MVRVLKTLVPQGTVGSNPTPSAKVIPGIGDPRLADARPERLRSRMTAEGFESQHGKAGQSKNKWNFSLGDVLKFG